MKTYNILIDYEYEGYNKIGNIFIVVWQILKNKEAKIVINLIK